MLLAVATMVLVVLNTSSMMFFSGIDMDELVIRRAVWSDLPKVAALMGELSGSLLDSEGMDPEAVGENLRFMLGYESYVVLVAEVGGVAVGLISVSVRRTLLHAGSSAFIDELVVTRQHRGKGVAARLIAGAVDACKGRGCCEVELSTEFSNTVAREFYRSCGFREQGVFLEKGL